MDDNVIFKRILFVALLLMTCCFSLSANARSFMMVNNCSFPVWFGFSGDLPLPTPSDGNYQLAANGGRKLVDIPAVQWRGVIAGRTNCTSVSCETADCGNGSGPCIHRFNQPVTQAAFKLAPTGKDFYDVDVINGVNLGISIMPSVASTAGNPYFCGSPGAVTPSSGLGACSWKFSPPSAEYNLVVSGGNACRSNSDCSSGTICGVSFNPGQYSTLKKTCGRQLGYWTANQICSVQRSYGAPFICPTNLTHLMGCTDGESCYQRGAGADCCGCVNWDEVGIPVPPAPITQQCIKKNPNWVSSVQPTLKWLKKACPTLRTYPYDDMSSTFTCTQDINGLNAVNYTITFCPKEEPSRDIGTLKFEISNNSDKACNGATDTLFIDDHIVQDFIVTPNSELKKLLNVGLHKVSLKSRTGIPDKYDTGVCKSTLNVSNVLINKYKTSTVVATYKFTASLPKQKYSYLVIVGHPFLPVLINGRITCPDKNNVPRCLVSDQPVGTTITIKGQSNHYCGLRERADGGLDIRADSIYCFVYIIPARLKMAGQISLPSGF